MGAAKPLLRPVRMLEELSYPQAISGIQELARQEGYTQWKQGELYNYILDKRLYVKNGYRYARDIFTKDVKDVSQATLTLYGSVQRVYPEEIAQRYGMSPLGRLMTYIKVSKTEPVEGDPGPTPVLVPQKDGTEVEKTFASCSRDELARAIKRHKEPAPAIPPSDVAVVDCMHDALLEQLGADTRTAVKATYGEGKTLFTISQVDLTQLQQLINALQAAQKALSAEPVRPAPALRRRAGRA